jgi:hypothetical protein
MKGILKCVPSPTTAWFNPEILSKITARFPASTGDKSKVVNYLRQKNCYKEEADFTIV